MYKKNDMGKKKHEKTKNIFLFPTLSIISPPNTDVNAENNIGISTK